ncbi:general secretion pathway protein GspD [Malaciobacter halophilus]|uniref:General secretion pathway protein GspD n=1 Tax=Malaciobacter halophilus TaxID=197482 RepID=A0A2N1J0E1_9BACT|nr:secretin N-terminal domain-containing protein [Malaciobacter halophilus]AXH10288.1 type II secretion/transformation system, D protein [Malaciobacter halophilus]PKI79974.1 general secretion pathway protein GspD [Malaciobacter halophilus]
MHRIILIVLTFTLIVFSKEIKKEVKFENLDINELIKISSKVLNKNILVKSQIEGKVNYISNKPITKQEFLKVLKTSLDSLGYKLINKNSFYEIEQKKRVVEYKKKSNNLTKVIALKNIDVKNLDKILTNYKKINNNKKLFISSDIDSNTIVLIGKKEIVNSLEKLIEKLDKDEPQIFLKAKIVEVNNNLINKVGLKYGLLSGKSSNSGIFTIASNLNSYEAVDFDISSIGLSIPTLKSSISLGATLSLLHQNYALKIVSEPSLLCINNKKSSIYVGETISLQTSSTTTSGGNTSYSYERKDVGLKLEVIPRLINKNNKVRLYINTILEGVKNSSTNNQPDTTKKSVSTYAIVSNGESIVLGGLIERRDEDLNDSVPFLSSIPLFGGLFKHDNSVNRQNSLIIVITPYIVPKNKDISYIREQLSKLELLEELILNKSINTKNLKNSNNYEELHKKRVKQILQLQ